MKSLSEETPRRLTRADFDSADVEITIAPQRAEERYSAWLEGRKGDSVFRYPISDSEFIIGRANHCNLALESDGRFVSREHAKIIASAGKFWILDLSMNGTWVNGARLTRRKRRELQPGDKITIEDQEFTFRASRSSDR